jgi:hypothetical protein
MVGVAFIAIIVALGVYFYHREKQDREKYILCMLEEIASQFPNYGAVSQGVCAAIGNRGKTPGGHAEAGARMSSAKLCTAGASGTPRRSPR